MRVTNFRFLSTYSFLVFDSIELFGEELWINFSEVYKVRKIIREVLTPYINSKMDIFGDSLLITSKINYELRSLLKDDFFKLIWWIRNVYISGGDDRLSETIWARCCVKVKQRPEEYTNLEEKLKNKMLNVGNHYLLEKKKIDQKYSNLESQFLTEFNTKFIELLGLDLETIEATISLISGCNLFVDLWKKEFIDASYEDYLKLFNFGKNILPKIMPKIEIQFPGNWTYELDEYAK